MTSDVEVKALEALRRELERHESAAGSIEDGIEKGWIRGAQQVPLQAEMRESRERAEALRTQLEAEVTRHRHADDGVVRALAVLHLETCAHLLRNRPELPRKDAGVRAVCIGYVLSGLGELLAGTQFYFRVNGFYLPDYYAEFDQLHGAIDSP